jgi:membrane protein
MTLGAALAFYVTLAMAPLLLCLMAVAGLAGSQFEDRLAQQVGELVGPRAGEAVTMIVDSASRDEELGSFSGLVGIGMLLLGASGAFAQLQYAMNRVWNVQAKPGQGLWGWLRKRFLSAGMVLTVGFLLLVSMGLSAALSGASASAKDLLPGTDFIWPVLDAFLSLFTVVALFALMFKVLPDVRIAWREVWIGGLVTAALFVVGKTMIALYLGQTSVGSAYGAAGSLIVLLLWVNYASLILLFGAEITQAYAEYRGIRIEPDEHAVRIVQPQPQEIPGSGPARGKAHATLRTARS